MPRNRRKKKSKAKQKKEKFDNIINEQKKDSENAHKPSELAKNLNQRSTPIMDNAMRIDTPDSVLEQLDDIAPVSSSKFTESGENFRDTPDLEHVPSVVEKEKEIEEIQKLGKVQEFYKRRQSQTQAPLKKVMQQAAPKKKSPDEEIRATKQGIDQKRSSIRQEIEATPEPYVEPPKLEKPVQLTTPDSPEVKVLKATETNLDDFLDVHEKITGSKNSSAEGTPEVTEVSSPVESATIDTPVEDVNEFDESYEVSESAEATQLETEPIPHINEDPDHTPIEAFEIIEPDFDTKMEAEPPVETFEEFGEDFIVDEEKPADTEEPVKEEVAAVEEPQPSGNIKIIGVDADIPVGWGMMSNTEADELADKIHELMSDDDKCFAVTGRWVILNPDNGGHVVRMTGRTPDPTGQVVIIRDEVAAAAESERLKETQACVVEEVAAVEEPEKEVEEPKIDEPVKEESIAAEETVKEEEPIAAEEPVQQETPAEANEILPALKEASDTIPVRDTTSTSTQKIPEIDVDLDDAPFQERTVSPILGSEISIDDVFGTEEECKMDEIILTPTETRPSRPSLGRRVSFKEDAKGEIVQEVLTSKSATEKLTVQIPVAGIKHIVEEADKTLHRSSTSLLISMISNHEYPI